MEAARRMQSLGTRIGEPGLASDTVGAVESTVTVMDGLVKVLPAFL